MTTNHRVSQLGFLKDKELTKLVSSFTKQSVHASEPWQVVNYVYGIGGQHSSHLDEFRNVDDIFEDDAFSRIANLFIYKAYLK